MEAEDRGDYLRRRSVRAPTRARYLAAASAVAEFACALEFKLKSTKDVDSVLERYMTELYFDGEAVQTGRVALYGYAWRAGLPTRGTAFPLAKQASKGWGTATPPQSHDPVPWAAVLLVAEQLLIMKNTSAVFAAALMILNSDCYLRPAEGLGLARSDVCTGSGSGVYAQWAIIIGHRASIDVPTKTGTFDDTITVGETMTRRWVVDILAALYRRCSGHQHTFFGLTHSAFRGLLRIGSAAAGLPFTVLPHGLRHGGPSRDALHGHYTLRRIQQRGRWAAWEFVRRYARAPLEDDRQVQPRAARQGRDPGALVGQEPDLGDQELAATAVVICTCFSVLPPALPAQTSHRYGGMGYWHKFFQSSSWQLPLLAAIGFVYPALAESARRVPAKQPSIGHA